MSLDLDDRQRAMLREMGVRVWWPQAPVELDVAAPAHSLQTSNPAAQETPAPQTPIEVRALQALNTPNARPVAAVPRASAPTLTPPAADLEGIAGMDWPLLAQTVADCQTCQLCTGRRAPVFGVRPDQLPGQADWLVVGEPPDDAEERAGSPFADQAGQLLDNMLKAVGASRNTADGGRAATYAAYATNVVKCRPALARNPEPQELAACENYLRREVALVQPKVILALGRFAAQTLLRDSLPESGNTPLGKLRGAVHRYQGIPVVVSYPPTYLLRTPQDKARAWADLCLALEVVQRTS